MFLSVLDYNPSTKVFNLIDLDTGNLYKQKWSDLCDKLNSDANFIVDGIVPSGYKNYKIYDRDLAFYLYNIHRELLYKTNMTEQKASRIAHDGYAPRYNKTSPELVISEAQAIRSGLYFIVDYEYINNCLNFRIVYCNIIDDDKLIRYDSALININSLKILCGNQYINYISTSVYKNLSSRIKLANDSIKHIIGKAKLLYKCDIGLDFIIYYEEDVSCFRPIMRPKKSRAQGGLQGRPIRTYYICRFHAYTKYSKYSLDNSVYNSVYNKVWKDYCDILGIVTSSDNFYLYFINRVKLNDLDIKDIMAKNILKSR